MKVADVIGIYAALVATSSVVWQVRIHRIAKRPQLTVRCGAPAIMKATTDSSLPPLSAPRMREKSDVPEKPEDRWFCSLQVVNSGQISVQLAELLAYQPYGNSGQFSWHLDQDAGLPRWLEPGERLEFVMVTVKVTSDTTTQLLFLPNAELSIPLIVRATASTGHEFTEMLTPEVEPGFRTVNLSDMQAEARKNDRLRDLGIRPLVERKHPDADKPSKPQGDIK